MFVCHCVDLLKIWEFCLLLLFYLPNITLSNNLPLIEEILGKVLNHLRNRSEVKLYFSGLDFLLNLFHILAVIFSHLLCFQMSAEVYHSVLSLLIWLDKSFSLCSYLITGLNFFMYVMPICISFMNCSFICPFFYWNVYFKI